jgi:hypothetical protein
LPGIAALHLLIPAASTHVLQRLRRAFHQGDVPHRIGRTFDQRGSRIAQPRKRRGIQRTEK